MELCASPVDRRNLTFGQTVNEFLKLPGLSLAHILGEQRIAGVLSEYGGLFIACTPPRSRHVASEDAGNRSARASTMVLCPVNLASSEPR